LPCPGSFPAISLGRSTPLADPSSMRGQGTKSVRLLLLFL
jgi:hypothetical protein